MLPQFLEVLYANETELQQSVKLAHNLQNLSEEELYALATGQTKLAFGDSEDWLEKYRGTELFDQAMALEKASLENDVARSQADAARPQMDQFSDTADQIRLQKKMLDLQLVEHQEGGAPMQAGGQLPEAVPGAAQGAGALGDMASEGASDGATGMQGKTGSVANFLKAAAGLGGLASSAVSIARKNPAAVGAGLGSIVGALTAKRDPQTGEKHYIRGAVGGAVAGGALGHAAGGIGNRMASTTAAGAAQTPMGLVDAAKGYAGDTGGAIKDKFMAAKNKLMPGAPVAAGTSPAAPAAAASVGSQVIDRTGGGVSPAAPGGPIRLSGRAASHGGFSPDVPSTKLPPKPSRYLSEPATPRTTRDERHPIRLNSVGNPDRSSGSIVHLSPDIGVRANTGF